MNPKVHTRLSVNINKVALIRNSRGENQPNLVKVAQDCERFGAEGITVHPRPDQRHVRYDDIPLLKEVVTTEFNIEGNPIPKFIDLVLANTPHQVTLVPDAPDALTSNNGWDTVKHEHFLTEVIQTFKDKGIRVSIFVNSDPKHVEGAKKVGADRIELYTGPYAKDFLKDKKAAVMPYALCSKVAQEIGIDVNAGHDLNLDNLKYFRQELPLLHEVSIGHALIGDALYYGFENTIQMYLRELA